jgi:hypothetical protein
VYKRKDTDPAETQEPAKGKSQMMYKPKTQSKDEAAHEDSDIDQAIEEIHNDERQQSDEENSELLRQAAEQNQKE